MTVPRITVGVFALDQVLLPQGSAKGWATRLAAAVPRLRDTAQPLALDFVEGRDGLVLAEGARLGRTEWRAGTRAQVDPVAGRAGLFLIRIGGKAAGVASAADWPPGSEHDASGPVEPEALAAYAGDTLIDTPDGPRAAASLVAGDVVTTLANGSRPLRWVGRRRVAAVEMLAHPGLRPVEFAPGSMGNDPALIVSPRKRLLIDDWRAAVYFGEDRVLVPASALVDGQEARLVLPPDGVEYVVLLCDRHEILLAAGALSESFHPGETGLAGLPKRDRAALAEIVPEAELQRRRAAFPIVRHAEARALRPQG